MHTALLFTNSSQTESDLTRIFADRLKVVSRAVSAKSPAESVRDASHDLRCADAVIVDTPSIGTVSKIFIESLSSATVALPVIVRLSVEQTASFALPDSWIVSLDSDSPQRLRSILEMVLSHRDLKLRTDQLQRLGTQQQQQLAAARDWNRADQLRSGTGVAQYRDWLKTLSRLLSGAGDVETLAERFLELLREQMGLSKLALFLRPMDVFADTNGVTKGSAESMRCVAALGAGSATSTVRSLTLSLQDGIGRHLTAEGQILRRSQMMEPSLNLFDPHIIREFELLGAEFVVPVQDSETTFGALAFSGKITGEDITTEDLEFAFALCGTVAESVTRIWLSAQIAARQQFSDDILASIQSGVIVLNQQAQMITFNARAADLLDFSALPPRRRELAELPPLVADLLFETLHTGKCHKGAEVSLPDRGRVLSVTTSRFSTRPDGRREPHKDFVVAAVDDVTEARADEALARETESNKFWMLLATRLSHELRNALVSIRTFAQLLPEKHSDAKFRSEFSKTMETEVGRVDKLVGEINFFAQPLSLNLQTLPVADVLEASVSGVCAEMWRTAGLDGDFSGVKPSSIVTPKGKTVNIQRHFTHTIAAISADKKRFEDALAHLIRNSIQSMQDNGGRLSIGTEDVADEESSPCGIKISVSDTGDGIAVSELEQVFEPLYTTRNVGVGLGLAIVKKTVEAHRGRIEVSSKLGKGTTISVTLPASRGVDLSEPKPLRADRGSAPAVSEAARPRFGPVRRPTDE